MNIIFEGVNGTGKTSIIEELANIMKKNKMEVHSISEINEISPLATVLEEMYKGDTFLRLKKNYDTVITESLILAADYHYMQEVSKEYGGYKIFDRDIFTQIVYQKYFIEKTYGKNNVFFDAWKKCIMFNMKKIDIIIYVEANIDICIERTIKRDNTIFDEEKRRILLDLYKLQKEYIINYSKQNNVPLVILDGTADIKYNAKKVFKYVIENFSKGEKNE